MKETLSSLSNLKLYKILLSNYSLTKVSVESFQDHFAVYSHEEVIDYILDSNHGYELSRFGHSKDKIKAYNGKSRYRGQVCTLGISHSNFSG